MTCFRQFWWELGTAETASTAKSSRPSRADGPTPPSKLTGEDFYEVPTRPSMPKGPFGRSAHRWTPSSGSRTRRSIASARCDVVGLRPDPARSGFRRRDVLRARRTGRPYRLVAGWPRALYGRRPEQRRPVDLPPAGGVERFFDVPQHVANLPLEVAHGGIELRPGERLQPTRKPHLVRADDLSSRPPELEELLLRRNGPIERCGQLPSVLILCLPGSDDGPADAEELDEKPRSDEDVRRDGAPEFRTGMVFLIRENADLYDDPEQDSECRASRPLFVGLQAIMRRLLGLADVRHAPVPYARQEREYSVVGCAASGRGRCIQELSAKIRAWSEGVSPVFLDERSSFGYLREFTTPSNTATCSSNEGMEQLFRLSLPRKRRLGGVCIWEIWGGCFPECRAPRTGGMDRLVAENGRLGARIYAKVRAPLGRNRRLKGYSHRRQQVPWPTQVVISIASFNN